MNEIEQLLRTLAPAVLGPLVRRYGGFDTCEDAVQEALLAAARQWPAEGVPENPRGVTAMIVKGEPLRSMGLPITEVSAPNRRLQ